MNFRILNLRQLSSGGHGDLFIGQRSDSGEDVVIKYLRECQLPEARQAFAREVRVLGRGLRGLVPIIFADIETERPFYVMPHMKGGTLTGYSGRLTAGQLQNVAAELAVTLAALHSSWVSHGDLKPANILVSHDGELRVADPLGNGFGCTVLFSRNHGGTPGYWAPEIRAGAPISHAGDVYSFGATLYELLTGRKPIDDHPFNFIGAAHAPKIREIIAACCLVDPDARPSIEEVLRMVGGAAWADIQLTRKQRNEFVSAVSTIGIAGLLLYGFSRLSRA